MNMFICLAFLVELILGFVYGPISHDLVEVIIAYITGGCVLMQSLHYSHPQCLDGNVHLRLPTKNEWLELALLTTLQVVWCLVIWEPRILYAIGLCIAGKFLGGQARQRLRNTHAYGNPLIGKELVWFENLQAARKRRKVL